MKMETNTTLDEVYFIDDSDAGVLIEVEVGASGQTSLMTIKLDGEIIVQNHSGNLSKTLLGTNNTLNGKKLSVAATIADTSKTTNVTSLTIYLTGGVVDIPYPLTKTVENEGESANYICLIELTQV